MQYNLSTTYFAKFYVKNEWIHNLEISVLKIELKYFT